MNDRIDPAPSSHELGLDLNRAAQTSANTQLGDVATLAQQRIESVHSRSLQQVGCEHRDGVLTLRGQVPTFHHKQVAQECVRNLPGVVRIVNCIEVVPTPIARRR